VWWWTLVISAFRRKRQENHNLKVSLGCIIRPHLKNKNGNPELYSGIRP
jgi:hypothetical protein